jgi:hypothetical protein
MEDKVTAFEITDMDGFYKSLTNEAFSESAILVGKKFFRRTKKDMETFKKLVIDYKEKLVPKDEFIIHEIEKCLFTTAEHGNSTYIMPNDMEYVIEKVSNEITYNIMSHLTKNDVLEMCYSPESEDVIWRIKK